MHAIIFNTLITKEQSTIIYDPSFALKKSMERKTCLLHNIAQSKALLISAISKNSNRFIYKIFNNVKI